MSRKNILLKYQTVTAGDLSLATVTSSVTNINYLDDIGIQCNIGGSPNGVIAVQVSADYYQDEFGNVKVVGNWVTLTSSTITAGQPATVYFDLTQLSAPWIRLQYTRTSGTGTLNAFITGKAV